MTAATDAAQFRLDFIVVGSRKCATTWLYELFVAHPEIRVSTVVKESGYFGRNHSKGLSWYQSLFPDVGSTWLTGEVDAELLRNADTVERIGREFPRARVIAIFRNPADLFFSSFDHAVRKGDLTCSAEEAWRTYPEFRAELQFGTMAQRLLQVFPREQLCLVLYEDIERDPTAVLATLQGFLGLQSPFPSSALDMRVNVSRSARFPGLAKALSRGARAARRLGLHRAVTALKELPGVQRLYKPKDRAMVARERSGALRAEILAEMAPQTAIFAQRSGLPVERRWAASV